MLDLLLDAVQFFSSSHDFVVSIGNTQGKEKICCIPSMQKCEHRLGQAYGFLLNLKSERKEKSITYMYIYIMFEKNDADLLKFIKRGEF